MKKPLLITLTILGVTLFGYLSRNAIMKALGFGSPGTFSLLGLTAYRFVWNILIPALTIAALHKPRRVLAELGWQANPLKGLMIGLLFTMPMLIGFSLFLTPVDAPAEKMLLDVYKNSFWAALAEETVFRAFLFGQLFRHGRWPFWVAVGAQAILFGVGHLYQAHNGVQAAGVFAVTFAGALWFAWLWLTWQSLWVPIAVHMLMNAWWGLFAVADSTLGGWMANACRVATIALSIWFTLRMLKREGRTARVWNQEVKQTAGLPATSALAL
ncbi:CPBP family intramembrane glutamic endopeptidase [Fibrella forsythiae]|uniref:CPBP family intramembrane metalloprotease n=1 Tax=Fibrella forsythiae TaxID=2817061 RepID=A0ABS3JMX2_9BACT|nr:type II CAAX endopeptidase family protein [Fibrella forsythiae]MBO0951330.1 CPBP family intramembrane metalloprotease [Fibrella forsythiae]